MRGRAKWQRFVTAILMTELDHAVARLASRRAAIAPKPRLAMLPSVLLTLAAVLLGSNFCADRGSCIVAELIALQITARRRRYQHTARRRRDSIKPWLQA